MFSPACANGTYGDKCNFNCSLHCAGIGKKCDFRDGNCTAGCVKGYQEPTCQQRKRERNRDRRERERERERERKIEIEREKKRDREREREMKTEIEKERESETEVEKEREENRIRDREGDDFMIMSGDTIKLV